MHLHSIHMWNFRCYGELDVEFDPRFNVISGLNGQGKTTILEAIYLLAALKSFRMGKNQELVRWGQETALVRGQVQHGNITTDLSVKVSPRSKQGTVNGKSCRFLSDYIGKLAAVTFSPIDLEIIRGGPDIRRTWADRTAAVFDNLHAELCARYMKALMQRNRQLKEFAAGRAPLGGDFDAWSEELCRLGAEIIHRRIQVVDKMGPLSSIHYQRISGHPETIKISYKSELFPPGEAGQGHLDSVDSISQIFKEKQEEMLSKECLLGVSLVGPHRDDLEIELNGRSVRAFGSQGEVRSTVLALRLAEIEAHESVNGVSPLVLVDDFSSELDEQRRDFLLRYLESTGSQVFLTTTESLSLGKHLKASEGRILTHGH